MIMSPSKLRHRVTILEKQATRDADGYPVEKWTAVGRVWAAYEPISGKEYLRAAAVQAEQQVRFTMRYRAGVTTDKRIGFDDKDYEIKAVIDVGGQRRYLQVMAEVTTNG